MDQQKVSKYISQLRKAKAITQQELAKQSNVAYRSHAITLYRPFYDS